VTPPTFLLPLDSADPPPATPADDIIPAHELDAAMFEIVGPAKWVNAVQEDLLKRVGLEGVAPTYAASLRGKEKGEGGEKKPGRGKTRVRGSRGRGEARGGAAGGGAAPMES
jgi:hypothetical protein